jgi:hypothetical protein
MYAAQLDVLDPGAVGLHQQEEFRKDTEPVKDQTAHNIQTTRLDVLLELLQEAVVRVLKKHRLDGPALRQQQMQTAHKLQDPYLRHVRICAIIFLCMNTKKYKKLSRRESLH